MSITCQMCGTENGDGTKFCAACGNALASSGPDGGGRKAGASGAKSKTMMFAASPVTGGPAATSAATSGSEKTAPAKTVMGIPMAKPAGPEPVKAPAKPEKKAPARTMLGMAAVTAPVATDNTPEPKPVPAATSEPVSKPNGASRSPAGGHRTMLGMPMPDFDVASGDGEGAVPEKEAAPAPKVEHSERTVKASAETKPKPEPLSIPEPPTPAPPPTGPTRSSEPPPRGSDPDDDYDQYDSRTSGIPRSKSLAAAVIAASVTAVVAVLVVLYLTVFDNSKAVRPQVLPSADGKSLNVVLPFPEAPPGTTVQGAGMTVPVNQGQAQLVLPMAQIRLGTNNIAITYTEPGDSPEQMTFPIVLRHSITDDLSGLVTEDPFVTAAFQTAPGMRLTVNGKPVQLVNNVHFHKVRLADAAAARPSEGDFMMVKVPFQLIDEAGTVEQGEHMIAVPLTKLQIDRPAPNASVTADKVTCSGTSEEGAQITVNKSPAGLTAAGFSTIVPLPELGEHLIEVTARAPGKAPRTKTLKVKRIASLEPAVAEWSNDLDTSLDYPTIGRDPDAMVGKKVKLNGRVVNISTEKGVTAFILYVGEGCPARSKCAVYVVFRGETEAGLQSWVDVYGTVRGTRAVEMQNGVKIDVPAVDAVFVLKSERKTETRRGRRGVRNR